MREAVIDCIRRELRRQSEEHGNKFNMIKADDPDTFHVIGILDVHKLAVAIEERHR